MGTVFMMIKDLQKRIRETEHFDGALITSPENRFYFTDFASSDGFLLVSADRAVFITDGRYIEAAQNAVTSCEVVLQASVGTQLADIFAEMGVSKVAVETERISVAEFAKYSDFLKPADLIPDPLLDGIIRTLRMVKTPQEIKIKAAQRIAEAAFDHILGFITPVKPKRKSRWSWIFICFRTVHRHFRLKPSPSAAKNPRCRTAYPTAILCRTAILSRWISVL